MLSEVILPVLSAVRNSFKGPNQSPIEVLVLGSFYFEKKENIMFKMMKFKTLAILVTLTLSIEGRFNENQFNISCFNFFYDRVDR